MLLRGENDSKQSDEIQTPAGGVLDISLGGEVRPGSSMQSNGRRLFFSEKRLIIEPINLIINLLKIQVEYQSPNCESVLNLPKGGE